ncbi:MAG: AEC family transporter [Promethearchaeota archaeon]
MAHDLLSGLMEIYLFISIGAVIGYLLKKRREKVLQILTKVTIYIFTPILIFISLVTTEMVITFELILSIVSVQLISACTMMAIAFLLCKKSGNMDNKKLGGYLLIAAFPNATVFPLPIVLSVFGEEWLIIIFIYSSSALILRGTLGTYTSIKYGSVEGSVSLKETVIKFITFPPTLAIIVALLLLSLNVDMKFDFFLVIKPGLSTSTSWIGSGIIGMILAGLERKQVHEFKRDIPYSFLLRFAFPFALFLLMSPLISNDTNNMIFRTILLLEVTGPPAIFNAIFAVNFNLDRYFVATSVVIITFLMIFLAPVILLIGAALF